MTDTEDCEDLEEVADWLYTCYCVSVGGHAHDGKPLPGWREFRADPGRSRQSSAWIQVARMANALDAERKELKLKYGKLESK